MKLLRVAFLVLLAALLPLRGALAGVRCGGPAAQSAAAATAAAGPEGHAHSHHGGHAGQGDHHGDLHGGHHGAAHGEAAEAPGAGAATAPPDGGPGDDGVSGHAGCGKLCAAFCSLTPLPAAAPALPGAPPALALDFPRLSAVVPPFQSGAPERPPRTV